MDHGLALVVAPGDLLEFPYVGKLGAVRLELGEDPPGAGKVAARGERGTQPGRLGAALAWVVFSGVDQALGWVHGCGVPGTARQPVRACLVR
jgi:hypothetical protein